MYGVQRARVRMLRFTYTHSRQLHILYMDMRHGLQCAVPFSGVWGVIHDMMQFVDVSAFLCDSLFNTGSQLRVDLQLQLRFTYTAAYMDMRHGLQLQCAVPFRGVWGGDS